MGALQKLLSSLEDQRAVWPQIWAFPGNGSRGQRKEGDTSKPPLRLTEVEGESHLEPAADQDQGPSAVAVSVTADRPGAPLQPVEAGEAAQTLGGERARCLRPGSLRQECHPRQPREGCLEWEGTCW